MSRARPSLKLCALLLTLVLVTGGPSAFAQSCGTPGNDGPGTTSGVVNTYYPASAATETIAAGATSIALGAIAAGGSTTPIAIGDLVLVIQMQDATINTNNTTAYGSGAGTGNGLTGGTAGAYEFAIAASAVPVTGGTLTVSTALINSYHQAPYSAATQGQ